MKDHLRFACAYWHSFCNVGSDPFGEGTHSFEWDKKRMQLNEQKIKWMLPLNSLQK
jgi:xylose isomerase